MRSLWRPVYAETPTLDGVPPDRVLIGCLVQPHKGPARLVVRPGYAQHPTVRTLRAEEERGTLDFWPTKTPLPYGTGPVQEAPDVPNAVRWLRFAIRRSAAA